MFHLTFRKILIIGVALLAAVIALPTSFLYITNVENYDMNLSIDMTQYTGHEIKPDVTVTKGPITLDQGKHYTVEYKNNKEVGKATVVVKGKSAFRGTTEDTFSIRKAVQRIKGDNVIVVNIADKARMDQKARTDITYEVVDEKVIKLDKKGNIKPQSPGKTKVRVEAAETDSYRAASKVVNIEITETPVQAAIRGTLEWARRKAADDSYTYGRGQCPVCHGGNRVYDCIAFMTASYWHGGKVEMMERWCWNHNHTSVIRQAMINSDVWEGIGNPKEEDLEEGDVLFYYRPGGGKNGSGWFHVEIYNGNGQVVGAHTFGGKSCISVEPFNNYFRSYSDVYRYVGKQ